MGKQSQEIEDKRIYLSSKYYVTIGVLGAILLWVVSTTYLLINYFMISPRNDTLLEIKKNLADVNSQKDSLAAEMTTLKAAYKELLAKQETPVTLEPKDEATVIGQNITFKWDYRYHRKNQKYILEIRSVFDPNKKILKLNVVKPEQKLMHLPKSYIKSDEFLWRVLPGYFLGEKEVTQGPPSPFMFVKTYNSTVERLRKTKVFRVGTSPSFLGCFNFIGEAKVGEIRGFDIDLIKWITKKLGSKLRIDGDLRLIILQLPWSELLPSLANHELDAVISSMTSNKEREEKYKGVKFTEGYFKYHQIFIGPEKEGKFPQALAKLAKKKVGVLNGTTNEQAGRYLSSRFRFDIDNSFNSYEELYTCLENKKINYALVDDVLARGQIGERFHQIGPELDKYLAPFYKSDLGRQEEMYAIAVTEEPRITDNLLTSINDLLKSPEGKEKLKELTKTWVRE